MKLELKMYREVLEKFCKVFDLKLSITEESAAEESAGEAQTSPTCTVKILKMHDIEKSMHPIMFVEGYSYFISTSSSMIEDACKMYIENFLLDEKKNTRIYVGYQDDASSPHDRIYVTYGDNVALPYDRLENADLVFPRSSLEALVMFLDMVDTDGNV